MDINTPMQEHHHKGRLFKFLKVFIIVLTVFVGIKAYASLKEIIVGEPEFNVITIAGKGEIMATPDIANFTFTVTENGATAKDAQDKATAKSNAALAAIKASGVDDKDVKTLSYDVSPKYEYQSSVCPASANGISYPCTPGRQVINGYTVSQTIEVKVRKIDDASPLLPKITAIGVSNISGINFIVDDQDKLMDQARAMAIADAKVRAQTLSKALGVSLGEVVSFSDDQSGPIYYDKAYAMESMAVSASAPAPQLPTGQNKITSNVSVTYKIK